MRTLNLGFVWQIPSDMALSMLAALQPPRTLAERLVV
jgi:hypothetical protein